MFPASTREPYGNDQATVTELNAMIRPGSDYFERVKLTKLLQRGGDFLRVAPSDTFVATAALEAPRVVNAVDEENIPGGAVDHQGLIVERILALRAEILFGRRGIRLHFQSGVNASVGEFLWCFPRAAHVGTAPQK